MDTHPAKDEPVASKAKRMPKDPKKDADHTRKDHQDISDIDSDTFESENDGSEISSEASEVGDDSLENDSIADSSDSNEENHLDTRISIELLKLQPHRELLVACVCDNNPAVRQAIGALDTNNATSEEFIRLFEQAILLSARLGHLNALEVLLEHRRNHLKDGNRLADALAMIRPTKTDTLEVLNLLFMYDFKIGCNSRDKRSELEMIIIGRD